MLKAAFRGLLVFRQGLALSLQLGVLFSLQLVAIFDKKVLDVQADFFSKIIHQPALILQILNQIIVELLHIRNSIAHAKIVQLLRPLTRTLPDLL